MTCVAYLGSALVSEIPWGTWNIYPEDNGGRQVAANITDFKVTFLNSSARSYKAHHHPYLDWLL